MPKSCEIKSIDKNWIRKCNWYSFINNFYGNEDNFLKNGFGIILVRNDEVISEAISCYIGGGFIETGSITNEKYRGKGYATIVRAFLLKETLKRNLIPVTSCNANNFASAKVSQKLGFVEKMRYEFLNLK